MATDDKHPDDAVTMTPTDKLPGELDGVADKQGPAVGDLGEDLAAIRQKIREQGPRTLRLTQRIQALRALVLGSTS